MPAASAASLAALTSEISNERTTVNVDITFKKQGQPTAAAAGDTTTDLFSSHSSSGVVAGSGGGDSPDGPEADSVVGLTGWWHASDVRIHCFVATYTTTVPCEYGAKPL